MEEKFDEIFEIAETQYNISRTHFADLIITFYKNEHYGYYTNILDSDDIKQLIKSELKALGRQKEELAKCIRPFKETEVCEIRKMFRLYEDICDLIDAIRNFTNNNSREYSENQSQRVRALTTGSFSLYFCLHGGIGRRTGLKIRWLYGRVGSSPTGGTNDILKGEKMKLSTLTDDELWQISMKRNKKGLYTSDALRAQEMLQTRHGSNWGKRQDFRKDSWDGSFDNAVRIMET